MSFTFYHQEGRTLRGDSGAALREESPNRLGWLLGHGPRCTGRYPAVDQKGLSCYVGTGVRGQEYDGSVKVTGNARSFQGNAVDQVLHPVLVFVQDGSLGCLEPAWSETIDGNSVDSPVVGQTHCQLFRSSTAGTIRARPP